MTHKKHDREVMLRLTDEQHEQLSCLAAADRRPLAAYIRYVVAEHLDEVRAA